MRKSKQFSISITVSAALILFSANAFAISGGDAVKQLSSQAYNGDAASLQTLKQDAMNGDAASENWYGGYLDAKKDYAQAAMWYRKAADQGVANAQINLAMLYANGQGVAQDYAQAAVWYKKAADHGVVDAQSNLGVLYANGQGVTQDYAQAAAWFRKAADQGDGQAQNDLGLLYEKGESIPQNHIIAYALYNLSASNGRSSNNTALTNRDAIVPLMSEAQIKAGQGLAQEMAANGVTAAIGNYLMPRKKITYQKRKHQ
ncbi:tetratricopeptide repeat protein [Sulfuriferula nivalis]|uniref:Sel1 repeat family protein n=1 Tax=Sulfuriferula nivalis TaxID=2675298 RepID=A0A809SIP6_9PROT|nr:tetratricopeptide repeat protein [Sulfuriferula nivalis]BBP02250.1 hypothetical protein SFSGTM_29580 [Sulfuriferula nivalis]